MFTTFMKNGGYRVDYLFRATDCVQHALALYVCGKKKPGDVICRQAKQRLLYGLALITTHLHAEPLKAVYVDVCGPVSTQRPAYDQLLADIRSGLIRRVVVVDWKDLVNNAKNLSEVQSLEKEYEDFELVVCEGKHANLNQVKRSIAWMAA